MEVALPALEIQEFLESFARQQQWRISDERMGEDWWTFSRDLNRDELLQATKKTPDREKVDWKSGTSMIRISTLHLEDGYTRTVIRATFRGYGLSEDRFAMQRDYWELETSGSMEEGLISALKAHLQSKH